MLGFQQKGIEVFRFSRHKIYSSVLSIAVAVIGHIFLHDGQNSSFQLLRQPPKWNSIACPVLYLKMPSLDKRVFEITCIFSSTEVCKFCCNVSISWKHEITSPGSKAEVPKLASTVCSIFLSESHFRDKHGVDMMRNFVHRGKTLGHAA
jgi:hypothetical protein